MRETMNDFIDEYKVDYQINCEQIPGESAAAKLMLACLDRQLYPSWDAQNPVSDNLAKKLGYRFDREYPVYEMYYDRKGEMIHG